MKILFIIGTRPEAIKMAPLIRACRERPDDFTVSLCVTGQHRELLDQVLSFFSLVPDYDLALMRDNQGLFEVSARALTGLEKILREAPFDLLMVQGDTTTAFIGALAGYYAKIKVGHVEAGLRSGNNYSPYPEEVNRTLIGHVADYHFAPTRRAVENLRGEGITENVWLVGNTVIDALFLGLRMINDSGASAFESGFEGVDFSKRIVLVTCHRRESFGKTFEGICHALRDIAATHPDVELVYPVHLNPNVREPVNRICGGRPNIHLIGPLDYPHLIRLMQKSHLVLTDSGGIQEEAPSLGKPVLVLREVTERTEGIEAGTALLVGTDKEAIVREVNRLLTDGSAYQKMAAATNPYGDGTASRKIVDILHSLQNK